MCFGGQRWLGHDLLMGTRFPLDINNVRAAIRRAAREHYAGADIKSIELYLAKANGNRNAPFLRRCDENLVQLQQEDIPTEIQSRYLKSSKRLVSSEGLDAALSNVDVRASHADAVHLLALASVDRRFYVDWCRCIRRVWTQVPRWILASMLLVYFIAINALLQIAIHRNKHSSDPMWLKDCGDMIIGAAGVGGALAALLYCTRGLSVAS